MMFCIVLCSFPIYCLTIIYYLLELHTRRNLILFLPVWFQRALWTGMVSAVTRPALCVITSLSVTQSPAPASVRQASMVRYVKKVSCNS